jgi:hypothetical protein
MPHLDAILRPLRVREEKMQAIQNGYRGVSLLMDLNWDRAFFIGAITVALGAGAWIGSLLGS